MSQPDRRPSFINGMLHNKCPNCRRGEVFCHKSIFPLRTFLDIVSHCSICGQKMKSESNNGAGINYALTVILMFLNLIWYWPIFGLSYMDNSVFYFLAVSITLVVLLQPWLMRLSRMIYLYLYVSSGSSPTAPDSH